MQKDTELRKLTVLGLEWYIEIDHTTESVCIYNDDNIKIDEVEYYELQVIAQNLLNISKELQNESS